MLALLAQSGSECDLGVTIRVVQQPSHRKPPALRSPSTSAALTLIKAQFDCDHHKGVNNLYARAAIARARRREAQPIASGRQVR